MSDDVARFGLVAEDGVSGPAGQAARELQKLQSSLDADTKSLTAMNKAMRNLKQATTPNQAQMTALQKQIDATKQSISAAQSKILDLGGSFKKTKPPEPKLVADWKAKLKDVADQAAKMPGPLGQMAGAASRFLSTLCASVQRFSQLGSIQALAV